MLKFPLGAYIWLDDIYVYNIVYIKQSHYVFKTRVILLTIDKIYTILYILKQMKSMHFFKEQKIFIIYYI